MESIGSQLRNAREARGLTISQAASATRIKYQHIEAIERDEFSTFAAAAYARGFIKIYAEYVGLEPAPLLDLYRSRHAPVERRPALTEKGRASAARAPAAKAPEPEAEAGSGPAGVEGWFPPGVVKRVILPVAGIVLLVLLAVSVTRMLSGDEDAPEGSAGVGTAVDPLWLEDPPDPYVPAAGDPETAP